MIMVAVHADVHVDRNNVHVDRNNVYVDRNNASNIVFTKSD